MTQEKIERKRQTLILDIWGQSKTFYYEVFFDDFTNQKYDPEFLLGLIDNNQMLLQGEERWPIVKARRMSGID